MVKLKKYRVHKAICNVCNGNGFVKIMKEDKGIIIDLIRAAHSNAKNQLKSKTSEEISKATSGLGIPNFKWPI